MLPPGHEIRVVAAVGSRSWTRVWPTCARGPLERRTFVRELARREEAGQRVHTATTAILHTLPRVRNPGSAAAT